MAAVNKVSAPRGSRVSLEGVADEALPKHEQFLHSFRNT